MIQCNSRLSVSLPVGKYSPAPNDYVWLKFIDEWYAKVETYQGQNPIKRPDGSEWTIDKIITLPFRETLITQLLSIRRWTELLVEWDLLRGLFGAKPADYICYIMEMQPTFIRLGGFPYNRIDGA